MDWHRHWTEHPPRFEPRAFREQVGKTVGGRPVPDEQVARIVALVTTTLELGPGDRVLDVCCGNGLITRQVAGGVASVLGVDYSPFLVEVARSEQAAPNVEYLLDDARRMAAVPADPRFDAIYLYEGLQHFTPREVRGLLAEMRRRLTPGGRVLLGSIPDLARRWRFYDTWRRRAAWCARTVRGREAIGTWWDRRRLAALAESAGFDASCRDQPPELYTAHYRFDVLLRPRAERLEAGRCCDD